MCCHGSMHKSRRRRYRLRCQVSSTALLRLACVSQHLILQMAYESRVGRAGINDGLGFDGQKGPIREFTICSVRCAYRAESILGR